MKRKNLKSLRNEIDKMDAQIVDLLNKRARLSIDIGKIKIAKDEPLYSPDRENIVYDKVNRMSKGLLPADTIHAVYREIMSGCLSLQKPLVIAYLGPELTFTHQVSMRKFGASVSYMACDSISEVFRAVEKGNADYGVVPIENSIEGAVNHTMDMFVDSQLSICSEIYLRIRHSLLARSSSIRNIKKLYSHSQVLGQCRGWIEKNMPAVKLVEASSTAKAAEIAAKQPNSACIASELAADRNNIKILARGIEDSSTNVTRFLVIGKDVCKKASGKNKTSVMFSVKDKPGVLHDMLAAFKKDKINLTKIESRPSKMRAWKYYFYVDMEGHVEEKKIIDALKKLQGKCNFIKVLGSYPMG
jgi:chorismate mutase / prephenate dehydratase